MTNYDLWEEAIAIVIGSQLGHRIAILVTLLPLGPLAIQALILPRPPPDSSLLSLLGDMLDIDFFHATSRQEGKYNTYNSNYESIMHAVHVGLTQGAQHCW